MTIKARLCRAFYILVAVRLVMPVCFAFEAVMVEMTPVGEISMVFTVKAGMIMIVIGAVVVMATPCRIGIISISRISSFVDTNLHMHLCAGGVDRERGSYDHGDNK